MLGFGSNFGFIWKFVKCSLLPFFVFLFWPVIKQEFSKVLSRFREQSKQIFDQIFTSFRDFEMFIQEKYFFLNITSLQYAKFQMAYERKRNQSHYSISIVTIGLWKRLLWKDTWSGRHFCAQTNFSAH